MEEVVPPFRVDATGTFLLLPALRKARGRHRNRQVGLLTLCAVEDTEIWNLAGRLKAEGLKVITGGHLRSDAWSPDFICGLNGIQLRDDRKAPIELADGIGVRRHPVFDNLIFLTGVIGENVIARQVLPAPSRLLAELMKDTNRTQLGLIYPRLETLLVDITQVRQKLTMELCKSGRRYLQLDDTTRTVTDNAIRVNNMVLGNLPADLYIVSCSPIKMFFSLQGINAPFLDYSSECYGKNRLLWFIREKQSVLGFVLFHYPVEEEPEELRAKIDQIVHYIPSHHFLLCIPSARVLPSESYEGAEEKQWHTLRMAKMVAGEL